MAYDESLRLQAELVELRYQGRVENVLLLLEHPPVLTLGRNANRANVLASDALLASRGVTLHEINRGGDVTYHGPGQIVGYPILDLSRHRRDVRWYVGALEELMIRASADLGLAAKRREGCRGVWVDTPRGEEKLAALGVHLGRTTFLLKSSGERTQGTVLFLELKKTLHGSTYYPVVQFATLEGTSVQLVPPKPNELFIACRTARARDSLGT